MASPSDGQGKAWRCFTANPWKVPGAPATTITTEKGTGAGSSDVAVKGAALQSFLAATGTPFIKSCLECYTAVAPAMGGDKRAGFELCGNCALNAGLFPVYYKDDPKASAAERETTVACWSCLKSTATAGRWCKNDKDSATTQCIPKYEKPAVSSRDNPSGDAWANRSCILCARAEDSKECVQCMVKAPYMYFGKCLNLAGSG